MDVMLEQALSHYRIVERIGHGSMGEVYRARDSRLGRYVAIKVLPRELAGDAERIHRFEQEARAAGALNHPNVVAIYDTGLHEGSPYLVMELLEGRTLRALLSAGALPVHKALEYAAQAARGLAAAHAKGIIHRDLKPENLFVTADGRVKVLDFGLAKLALPQTLLSGETTAAYAATESGVLLGTVGYMAPEQIRDGRVDTRADLFSLGAVLYEMLTRRRAFQRGSPVETMNAILTEDPPPLTTDGRFFSAGLSGLVGRCLEKEPEQRFQSARDLALALDAVSGEFQWRPPRSRRRRMILALAALLVLTTHVGAFLLGRHEARRPVPSFQRITFRRGAVDAARFSPDGQTVVYTAQWEGKPAEVFSQRLGTAEARSHGLTGALVAATFGGEMAVILQDGTLARVPIEGGTPREVVDSVLEADWSRDGARSLALRQTEDRQRLEYPIGNVLLETKGLEEIRNPRLSPDGTKVAFVDAQNIGQHSGTVTIIDRSGRSRILSGGWLEIYGLAWSPDGREVWFTATTVGQTRSLHAVTLEGKERLVARMAGSLAIQDISRDGHVLLTHGQRRYELRGRMGGDAAERDLSWFDGTLTPYLAPDGTKMVFQEWGEAGGANASTYFRRMDGSSAVQLPEGPPFSVSPDWKSVLCEPTARNAGLRIVPIGAGEARTLPRGSIRELRWAYFHPDGKRIVIVGNEADRPVRMFVQRIAGGPPEPLTPEGVRTTGAANLIFSPDGRYCTARPRPREPYALYPMEGGEPRPIQGLDPTDGLRAWSEDGKSLFVTPQWSRFPTRVERLDLASGRKQPWLEVTPPDLAGISRIEDIRITPNGRYYAYFYVRRLYDLYVADGLR